MKTRWLYAGAVALLAYQVADVISLSFTFGN
jgi:hypothetical protein